MNKPKPDKPTEEQNWAGPSGQRWLANAARFEESLRPIGDALIAKANPSPGEHIIDVGCGAGAMSLDIAKRIAPTGSVTGLDISPALVAEASRRAAATPQKSLTRFILTDAARASLPSPKADCLLSRFGIMFFTDPYAAFQNLHSLIRPHGRLAIATWAPLKQNPWMFDLRNILASHFELPILPPRTPGPFAFDDPDYVHDILTKSNFTQIEITPFNTPMFVGGPNSSPDFAANFLLNAASIAQRALEAPPEILAKIRTQFAAHLQTFLTPNGVQMPASTFLATASV